MIVCKDAASANESLNTLLRAGDTVWIKGSRAMELDRVVGHLMFSW